jgi:soluble lytic murein transglycosylase
VLAARSALRLEKPEQAVALLKRWAADVPQPEGALLLGEAAEAAGDPKQAATAYAQVFYAHPLSEQAKTAEGALARLSAPPDPRVFARTETLRRAGQSAKAKAELLAAARRFTGLDRELALVRAHHGDYRGLSTLQTSLPEADAERRYLMHAAARRNSLEPQAEAALRGLESQYPKSPWTLEALISWGNHFLLRNEPASYKPLYRACVERFSTDRQAAYCHWKLAWIEWMRRGPDARKMLEEHVARFPSSEKAPAALYFTGRYAALLDRFPLSFYAVLARAKVAEVAYAPPAPEIFQPSSLSRLRVERASQLLRAGYPEWSEHELKFLSRDQPYVAATELAELTARQGAPDRGLRYIKSMAAGYLNLALESAPERFWRLAFPLPYERMLVQHSTSRELDPYFVAALIRQESEFNARAVSPARAYGLTQVLPSTGRQLSRRLGLGPFRTAMLFDPDVNLQLGTEYLRDLLERNGGKQEAALAAYNAGQTRVNQWATWFEYREPAEFIETIPFTETRTYVQAVLRNSYVYRRLYATPASRAAE